jgi:hypothetical protein
VLEILLRLGVGLAALMLLYGLLRFWRSWPRRGAALRLVDTTDADRSDETSPTGNPSLAQKFLHEMRTLQNDTSGAIELDGTMLGLLAPKNPARVTDEISQLLDDEAVSIGVLKFSPQQLVRWIANAFGRPVATTLEGTLAKDGDVFRFSMREIRLGSDQTSGAWAASEATTIEAIRSVVSQYAIATSPFTVTKEWGSMRAYRDAEAKLRAAASSVGKDRAAHLNQASARTSCVARSGVSP